MTDLSQPKRSFFDIADDLCCYFETLAMAEAELEITSDPETREEIQIGCKDIQAQIGRLGAELATKTDSAAGVLRRQATEIEAIAAEEMRLTQRRLTIERARQWLKGYLMEVMCATGTRLLRTPTTTLRIQGNGGVRPVEVTAPELVPAEYCWMEGKIRADLWCHLLERSGISTQIADLKRRPSLTLLGKALQEPCSYCDGQGKFMEPVKDYECSKCHGTGRLQIPGAHLLERGEHLRIL